MKKIFILSILLTSFFYINAQKTVKDLLMEQGAWFLFSTRVEEQVEEKVYTQIDFFKKDDFSSIFFDKEDKLYSVFSKNGSEMWEDRWRMVDDTHFVIVSPFDESVQVMGIIELSEKMLVIRNCSPIDEGTKCLTYTYFSTKEGWLPDKEIEELNTAGVMIVDKMVGENISQ